MHAKLTPVNLRDGPGENARPDAARAHENGLDLLCDVPPDVREASSGDPSRDAAAKAVAQVDFERPARVTSLVGNLRERIGPALTPGEAIGYLVSIGEALERLHASGVVHGNLKPWNVVFRADGVVVLAARVTHPRAFDLVGRPGVAARYMSPEQIRDQVLDHRHDLYCLGVIAWEMLTGGRPLFTGASAVGVLCRHLTAPIPLLPLELLRFQPVLERLLAKERSDRYQSAGELVVVLKGRFADVLAAPPAAGEPIDVRAA